MPPGHHAQSQISDLQSKPTKHKGFTKPHAAITELFQCKDKIYSQCLQVNLKLHFFFCRNISVEINRTLKIKYMGKNTILEPTKVVSLIWQATSTYN